MTTEWKASNASFDGYDSDLASAGILIESLRQQLSAALAACKLKDAAIKDLLEFATYSTCGKAHAVEAAKEALAIQPDDSALKDEWRFK